MSMNKQKQTQKRDGADGANQPKQTSFRPSTGAADRPGAAPDPSDRAPPVPDAEKSRIPQS